jgi:hypothetical protein
MPQLCIPFTSENAFKFLLLHHQNMGIGIVKKNLGEQFGFLKPFCIIALNTQPKLKKMKKVFLIFVLFIIAFTACKKNSSPPADPTPQIEAEGNWSLVWTSQEYGTKETYTSSDFPCLSNNKVFIKSDGTYKGIYTGIDRCYVIHTDVSSLIYGLPGDSTIGTWSQSRNTITLKNRWGTYTDQLQMAGSTAHLHERVVKNGITYESDYIR